MMIAVSYQINKTRFLSNNSTPFWTRHIQSRHIKWKSNSRALKWHLPRLLIPKTHGDMPISLWPIFWWP